MTTLIVIPARLAATRLPRKPLRDLGGAPLALRVWERVVQLNVADRVVVATESDEVAAVLGRANVEVVLTRLDHLSGTDRVAEVASRPGFRDYDIVVNVQGDEPFLGRDALRGAIGQVADHGFPLGTAAVPAPARVLDDAAIVKVVCGDDGRALYFSRAPIPYLRDAADQMVRDALVRMHLGLYAYTQTALAAWVALPPHALEVSERLEQLRPLAAGMRMGVAETREVPLMGGIDTEADLIRANRLWPSMVNARHQTPAITLDRALTPGVKA